MCCKSFYGIHVVLRRECRYISVIWMGPSIAHASFLRLQVQILLDCVWLKVENFCRYLWWAILFWKLSGKLTIRASGIKNVKKIVIIWSFSWGFLWKPFLTTCTLITLFTLNSSQLYIEDVFGYPHIWLTGSDIFCACLSRCYSCSRSPSCTTASWWLALAVAASPQPGECCLRPWRDWRGQKVSRMS